MLWETVRVRWLYSSSWGFQRCSFRLIGQFPEPQDVKRVTETGSTFLFIYVSFMFINCHRGSQVAQNESFMDKEFMHYEAPQIEIIEVEVEKGFTLSQMPGEGF